MAKNATPDLTMQGFYWVTTPIGRAYDASSDGTHSLLEVDHFSRGEGAPSKPVVVRWGRGRRTPSDVVWIGVTGPVVSTRFVDVLKDFRGWSTYPVEVCDGWGAFVPGFAGLVISGRCGRMLHDLSRTETEKRWSWQSYVGLYFDPDTWDGSDIFYPSFGRGPIITLRLHDALRGAGITNIHLERLSEVRTEKRMVDDMRTKREGPYADSVPPDLPLK